MLRNTKPNYLEYQEGGNKSTFKRYELYILKCLIHLSISIKIYIFNEY